MPILNGFPQGGDLSVGNEAVFNLGEPKEIGSVNLSGVYSSDNSPLTVPLVEIAAYPAAIILVFNIVSASGSSYVGFFSMNDGNPVIRPPLSNKKAIVFLPKMYENTATTYERAYYPNIVIGASSQSLDYSAQISKVDDSYQLKLPIEGSGCTINGSLRVYAWGYAD